MTLADVACQMRTCLVGCVHTLVDVVCHWSSSDDKSVLAMDDVEMPRLTLADKCSRILMMLVGRVHVKDHCVHAMHSACRPLMTLSNRCMLATDSMCIHHPTSGDCCV